MERIVNITGAYDKRDPNPSKNYGIHGMEMRFVLVGPKGATQFVVYTGLHLPHVEQDLWHKSAGDRFNPFKPMGADIGYHAKEPQYEGQEPIQDDCPYTGGKCYYDGSGLQADDFMPKFLAGGSDAVWKMLEQRYNEWLGEE